MLQSRVPHDGSSSRLARRQAAPTPRRIERPCDGVIASASFEQIVWARLDALEEVLLALQDRVEKMDASVNSRGGCAVCQACVKPSPPADEHEATSTSCSPRGSEMERDAVSPAAARYTQYVQELGVQISEQSIDPYQCTKEDTSHSIVHEAPTPRSSPVGAARQGSPLIYNAASSSRLSVDIKMVSSSLAAAREFLALR